MSTENSFDMRGRLAALSFWHRISAADSDELVQFMATHSSLATTEKVLDELRAVLCGVGIVGTIDGFDVIRRDSVIDLVDRRRAEAQAPDAEGRTG